MDKEIVYCNNGKYVKIVTFNYHVKYHKYKIVNNIEDATKFSNLDYYRNPNKEHFFYYNIKYNSWGYDSIENLVSDYIEKNLVKYNHINHKKLPNNFFEKPSLNFKSEIKKLTCSFLNIFYKNNEIYLPILISWKKELRKQKLKQIYDNKK